jgi:serine/threonine protein phosphatase 1
MTAPFFAPKIKYFELNTKGRDYVIGDVHGRYDLVYEALKMANFKEDVDRLFCVGDLIDRGEFSDHVLEFLSLPCVHAIRGNHEDILLGLYNSGEPSEERIAYIGEAIGLTWWLEVPIERRIQILRSLAQLPLVAEIETLRGTVGLIHGDLDPKLSWQEFKQEVENGNDDVIHEALWGRTRLGENIEEHVEGIGRIYVGHTVQESVRKLANVVAIDTGAVFNQHLTMAQLPVMTQVINDTQAPIGNVQVLYALEGDTTPFGRYSTILKK